MRVASLCALVVLSCALAPEVGAEDRLAAASAYMDALRKGAPRNACIAVAVIDGDRVRREIAGGCKRKSLFQIGSISKTFTGLLLADAVGRGEVGLDEPIGQKFGSTVPGGITYRELATHTCGLPRLPDNLVLDDASIMEYPYVDYGEEQLRSFLESHELGEKGTAAYSNLGMGLLGFALGRVAGGSYAAAIEARVTRQLGLRDTVVTPDKRQRRRVLDGHDNLFAPTRNWGFDALAGAGALYSSLDDMVRYAKANLDPSEDFAPTLELAHDKHADAPALGGSIGLGFLQSAEDDRRYYWHGGMTAGHASFLGFEPDADRAVIVLANVALAEVDAIGAYLGGVIEKLPEIPVESAEGPYAEYLGRFVLTKSFVIRVTSNGERLFLQATAQPRLRLEPVEGERAADRFDVVGVEAQVAFWRGSGGAVDWLMLRQGGITQRAVREGVTLAKPDVRVPEALLEKYLGKYRISPQLTMMITREGAQLYARVKGQPRLPVFPKSQSRFFFESVVAEIEFHLADGAKEAHELTLHQNGAHKAPRSR